ncbi:MAG: winged helix DNA-binding domain-containing protein [Proteobacteria bacterium]|nr:winged helix DNA-binding domain-containing protein [Pseudomonadota bacterium]
MLAFVRERGVVHPREVDAHFEHGKVTNWFGGSSNASTQLLDQMHYRGLLRIARRESGTRLYAVREADAEDAEPGSPAERFDALVDLAVNKYAPLPAHSLGKLLSYLCHGAPQWRKQRAAALARAKQRLARACIEGVDWYWPAGESPASRRWRLDDQVRLLAPFDPVVWDRARFGLFWDWEYRFEAYTPAPKRKLGYYAMPLLWREQVIGWGNLSVANGELRGDFGYVAGRAPREPAFRDGLDAELQRIGRFLRLDSLPQRMHLPSEGVTIR